MFPDRIRAFVAVRLNAEVEDEIAKFVQPLRELPSGIRWVRLANLHLTLRVLGNAVDSNLLSLLDQHLNQIAKQTLPFALQARGIGAFPNLQRPRTIWIGLVAEHLTQLVRQVEAAAEQAGFAPERRLYAPHLTIGRVRDLQGWQQIRQALGPSTNRDFGTAPVSEMVLYRSTLGRETSRYNALARYRLAGGFEA